MKLAASIKEVAKLSGVSAGTVSRAFNNYPDIKPETRERILRIAKEVGYSPTLSAKNLSSKKSSGMALILSQLLNEQVAGRECRWPGIHAAYDGRFLVSDHVRRMPLCD